MSLRNERLGGCRSLLPAPAGFLSMDLVAFLISANWGQGERRLGLRH